MPLATTNTKLMCPFHEKDEAKALGARWDSEQRLWYAPAGADLDSFKRWLPGGRHYLNVPFEEKDEAKALGAMWDVEKRRWYARATADLAVFAKWDKAPSTPPRVQPSAAGSMNTPSTSGQKRERERDATVPACPVHHVLLEGPRTVRNGQAHNIGRQFFVCPEKDDTCGMRGGWVWADGTAPFSAASCRRVEQFHALPHDTVGVGVTIGGGIQVVGDELQDGQLVNGSLQRAAQAESKPEH
jgi:hypothetical protein